MQTIKVDLENCYGIGRLDCEFGFQGDYRVHSVYAPNGFMKTSFARTMKDLADGEQPKDQMFPARTTRHQVLVDGAAIKPEQLLVIPPYEADYQSKQVSTLLVDATLKARYEAAIGAIEAAKKHLLDALKGRSGLGGRKITPESEILRVFGISDLLGALDLLTRVAREGDASLLDVRYEVLFSEKAIQFMTSADARSELVQYVGRYKDLVTQSPILNERFNHTSASSVEKSLADAKFFEARHWVTLNEDGKPVEIRAANELKQRIDQEVARVNNDPELKKVFLTFDRKISANDELRQLRDYLRDHQELLPQLGDIPALQKQVWGAYLQAERDALYGLVSHYEAGRIVIEQVIREATAQATDWAEVVERFNRRFFVPFRLSVQNQADVILKTASPRVQFVFEDDGDTVRVDDSKGLQAALSQGEKRALYLLNVLFEVRAREKAGAPVLVVVDDIADSFDYRNKYAIIEYLQEMASSGIFRLIVLTHNFDFHRSVSGRLNVNRDYRRYATRAGREVSLVAETLQKLTPLQYWQTHKRSDPEAFIASIPFVRNLAEYCHHEDVEGALTELLHIKPRTLSMTLADVDTEYVKLIKGYSAPSAPPRTDTVWSTLQAAASNIRGRAGSHAELESKVVMSIAIRLKAEQHMIVTIADQPFVQGITSNQTFKLLEKYRVLFPANVDELAVLDRVQLMTPENIHVNSFMYEPILDLGIDHLKKLYDDVEALPR